MGLAAPDLAKAPLLLLASSPGRKGRAGGATAAAETSDFGLAFVEAAGTAMAAVIVSPAGLGERELTSLPPVSLQSSSTPVAAAARTAASATSEDFAEIAGAFAAAFEALAAVPDTCETRDFAAAAGNVGAAAFEAEAALETTPAAAAFEAAGGGLGWALAAEP